MSLVILAILLCPITLGVFQSVKSVYSAKSLFIVKINHILCVNPVSPFCPRYLFKAGKNRPGVNFSAAERRAVY